MGDPSARKSVLWRLKTHVDPDSVFLLPHPYARKWTYGDGAGETLQEVFKVYASQVPHVGVERVSPLVQDTLLALASNRVRPNHVLFQNLRDEYRNASPSEATEIGRRVVEWLIKPGALDRLVSFLRMSHDAKLIGRIFIGFDGLDEGGTSANLKSIEKLLAITEDCDTFFSFVLGWSGTPGLPSITPELATELKRTAFFLQS